MSKKLGKNFNLSFMAKNLLNPEIVEVYRPPDYLGDEAVRTSYTKGMDFSFSIGGSW